MAAMCYASSQEEKCVLVVLGEMVQSELKLSDRGLSLYEGF